MKKNSLFSVLSLGTALVSNAVSNADLPEMGHREDSPLRQGCYRGSQISNSYYAVSALHSIGLKGWYLTTVEIANNLKNVNYDNLGYKENHNIVYRQKHPLFDLALVATDEVRRYDSPILPSDLTNLADEEDLNKSPWVLTLGTSLKLKDGTLELGSYPSHVCVSKLDSHNFRYLTLNKGDLDAFYKETGQVFRVLMLQREYTFLQNVLENSRGKEYLKAQELIAQKIKELDNKGSLLTQSIERLNNTLQSLFRNSMIPTNFEPLISKLNKKLDQEYSLLKEISEYRKELNRLTYAITNNKPFEKFSLEHRFTLYKSALSEMPMLENHMDKIWYATNPVWNGVADSKDIAAGIYGCPEINSDSLDHLNDMTINFPQKLVGITIPGGIEGKTSVAINLTHPDIKKWICKSISEYYKK